MKSENQQCDFYWCCISIAMASNKQGTILTHSQLHSIVSFGDANACTAVRLDWCHTSLTLDGNDASGQS
jgi:hypothetical protein